MRKTMKHTITRLMTLLTALCLLAGGAAAEDVPDFSAMLPLLDLTASAALRVGEKAETITPDGTLSEAFVYNFFLLGQEADASLGITAQMLLEPQAQQAYLSRAFAAQCPTLNGILAFEESYPYIGVRPMASDMSAEGDAVVLYGDLYQADKPLSAMTEEEYMRVTWLDRRAVAELRKDADAPNGWKLYSFSLEAELMMEEAAQSYFADTMVEYMNADLGFALQYPAVFTEDTLTEDANGIAGTLADGSASFYARRRANEDGYILSSYMAQLMQEAPGASVAINEASESGRLIRQWEDGMTQVDIVIVTDRWIYEAQLCYAPALAADFALYSDYMTNSFMADELGIG
ncbi:MAG: hypothetical protein ACI4MJ_11205 [Aristaeellaceae bacterium]